MGVIVRQKVKGGGLNGNYYEAGLFGLRGSIYYI
jgi:hypothetical protein